MSKLFPINRRSFLFYGMTLASYLTGASSTIAQPANSFKPFSFVFLSDCHLTSGIPDSYKLTQESQLFLQQAIKQINALNPDFVVFGGDQVESPGNEERNWQFFLDILQSLDCPWHFVLGEADVSGTDLVNKMHIYGRDWKGRGLSNSQPYWSYDVLPGVHLIGLDTSLANSTSGFISQDQLDWLKNELDQNIAPLTMIVSHHPLIAPPPYDQTSQGAQYLLPQAEIVRGMLAAHTNPIIALNGHVHINKATRQKNISYISCASLDVYPCAFRYFQVSPEKIEIQSHQVNFPALVKKAKDNLLNSNFACDLTGGHPRNFIKLTPGGRDDDKIITYIHKLETE